MNILANVAQRISVPALKKTSYAIVDVAASNSVSTSFTAANVLQPLNVTSKEIFKNQCLISVNAAAN